MRSLSDILGASFEVFEDEAHEHNRPAKPDGPVAKVKRTQDERDTEDDERSAESHTHKHTAKTVALKDINYKNPEMTSRELLEA